MTTLIIFYTWKHRTQRVYLVYMYLCEESHRLIFMVLCFATQLQITLLQGGTSRDDIVHQSTKVTSQVIVLDFCCSLSTQINIGFCSLQRSWDLNDLQDKECCYVFCEWKGRIGQVFLHWISESWLHRSFFHGHREQICYKNQVNNILLQWLLYSVNVCNTSREHLKHFLLLLFSWVEICSKDM